MSANWYLVRYRSDIFKNEPKNIGVVVVADDQSGAARFIGEREDGQFDGRSVKNVVASTEALKSWIQFIRYHIDHGIFDEAIHSLSRRTLDNYVIERRGVLTELGSSKNVSEAAHVLFNDLVTVPKSLAGTRLEDAVRHLLLDQLKVPKDRQIEQNISYEVTIRGEKRALHFDYRYINGKTTLMDKVSLLGQDRAVERQVNDLLFRLEHVRPEVQNAITFYDADVLESSPKLGSHLRLIERFSHTLNIRSKTALNDVQTELGIPMLV